MTAGRITAGRVSADKAPRKRGRAARTSAAPATQSRRRSTPAPEIVAESPAAREALLRHRQAIVAAHGVAQGALQGFVPHLGLGSILLPMLGALVVRAALDAVDGLRPLPTPENLAERYLRRLGAPKPVGPRVGPQIGPRVEPQGASRGTGKGAGDKGGGEKARRRRTRST